MTRKYGYLCAVLTFLAIVGCGGVAQTVETFKVGPDGKPVPGTTRLEETIDRSQFAIISGVGYMWDCNGDATIFGGESKQRQWVGVGSAGPCRGFGLGGSNVLAVSFDEFNYPGTSTSMFVSLPGSYAVKISDPIGGTHHGQHKMYLTTQLGGGCALHWDGVSACITEQPPSTFWAATFHDSSTFRPRGFDFSRRCGPTGTLSEVCQ